MQSILGAAYVAPGDSGALNTLVLACGLLVLLAAAAAEWRISHR
jgi:hypothetical protein